MCMKSYSTTHQVRLGISVSKIFKFKVKVFYSMDKALSGELQDTRIFYAHTHSTVMAFFNPTALRKAKLYILLHSERPKLYTILAFLSAKGLNCEIANLIIHLISYLNQLMQQHKQDQKLKVCFK